MSARKGSGFVTTIRISPDDQMSCIDIVERARCLIPGMSMSSVIARALAISCETLRESGTIPRRSGFEFEELTAPFSNTTKATQRVRLKVASKLALADRHALLSDQPRVPALPVGKDASRNVSDLFTDEDQAARYFKWLDASGLARSRIPTSPEEDRLFQRLASTERRTPTPPTVRTRDRNAQRREELRWKKRFDSDNWTTAEQDELDRLTGASQ